MSRKHSNEDEDADEDGMPKWDMIGEAHLVPYKAD